MGMNIKYLNNVLRYILEDTVIERRVDDNYINFPFFDGDDKFYPLSMEFLPTNFFYKPVSFYEYCRDMYGLTEDESQYIWEQYRNVIRNNTITESINESVDRMSRKDYLEKILQFLVDDTFIDFDRYVWVPPFIYPQHNFSFTSFPSSISFNTHIKDNYGLTKNEIKNLWGLYKTTIINKLSKYRYVNESVNRKDDYLNRVTQFIVDDTVVEYTSYGTIKFIPPFFKGYRYYEYEKNEEFILPFYSPLEFTEYCNNLYGLSDMKTIFTVWGKYKKLLSNNYQQSINESVNISDNKRFNDYVINDIIKNTSLEGHHFYLFDCNISVHLNHSRYNPFFEWVPECFYTIMDRHYGLDFDVSNKIWNWYGQYIIDLYLEDFNK
jgi:hypothetical protein